MKLAAVWLSGLASIALSSGAAAQSINPSLDRQQGETQVVGAITVPLGASSDARRTAPRFEIIARSDSGGTTSPVVVRDHERDWQERRIGFTLDGSETLMLNGRPAAVGETRDGVSTFGAIAIGVGVLLVISAFTLADAVDDLNDR